MGEESVPGYALPPNRLKVESSELVCASGTRGSAAGLAMTLLSGVCPSAETALDQRGAATVGRNPRWRMPWGSSGCCPAVISAAAGGAAP